MLHTCRYSSGYLLEYLQVYRWPPLFSYFLFIRSLLIIKLLIFPYTCIHYELLKTAWLWYGDLVYSCLFKCFNSLYMFELSACILIPTLSAKVGVCVSSQLLVSVLFIAVPTNTENFKLFPTFVNDALNIQVVVALELRVQSTNTRIQVYTLMWRHKLTWTMILVLRKVHPGEGRTWHMHDVHSHNKLRKSNKIFHMSSV